MIEEPLLQTVCGDLESQLPINEQLPEGGMLHIDKVLPYICIYRYKKPDLYFSGLLKTQASYLIVKDTVDISELIQCIATSMSKKLNSFLILEMWPERNNHDATFEISCPKDKAPATIKALQIGIDEMRLIYPEVSSTVNDTNMRHPDRLEPLMTIDQSKASGSLTIGISVPTIYQRPSENQVYSIFYRKFATYLSEIIKRTVFEFIRVQTSNPYDHFLMLGKTSLDKITMQADHDLAEISEGMSFLLRTTPVNSSEQWEQFKESKFSKKPSFTYRLIALDPEQEKRKLYDIPIEKVDDPTLAYILRDKRLEIEKQLTMLEERGTDSFRFVGESLYGRIEEDVLNGAKEILNTFSEGENASEIDKFTCHEFAEHAQKEIDYYQEKFPHLKLALEIRSDVAGIMVSETTLLISDQLNMDSNRCDALIQHEIATHILTYCNGKSQPLKQMYAGFAGYDQLQEGLAVLSEYLVGGLTKNRLRLLAGRVVAADSLVSGATFVDTFHLLHKEYNFPERTAYYITMRIYRGGGLTKDAVYLAGLINVLDYLKDGGKLETLYAGKFNTNHVPLIEELIYRNVLKKPELPRFLERPSVQERLQQIRKGITLTELLN
ncbi:flavohemoglobin expression-modulating QEGLA motif protein [Jejudonia soesokkakensis]|uniref:Flavohemoglobin expression-modulating QEGLA motif protein n=1 Tax=Jejudonia soesokkakensis TaxID=1323432 RepID=A0ABW2MWB7_9FLAO